MDELNSRWYQYTQQRWLALSKQFVQADPVVYTEDKSHDNELHRIFMFNNENALMRIRGRHLLADCVVIKADYADIVELKKKELAKAENWLRTTHQDIMDNFDSNVIKLRKKRKVIITPGAFDGLLEEDRD